MSLLVAVGPILLPTLKGDITEVVGEQLETVGAGVVPGERRPRAFALTIPVHADRLAANRWESGRTMRRQVRALMENASARLQGLYLAWSADPEQNGWLLIGGGDLKYAEGGITFSNFELALTDCYRVANMRTHRSARRLVRLDRRLASVARDYLGTLFSADFLAVTATARHYLGVGPTDVRVGSTGAPATVATITTRDGNLAYVEGLADNEIVDFEHAEGDLHKATVRVYDDRGVPGTETSWEAVYGPDQPVTGSLVMDNALSRVSLDLATGRLDIANWSGTAYVVNATAAHPSGASAFTARVMEWTTERAVLRVTSLLAAGVRGELYVTLQRGWTGPRLELYGRNAAGTATVSLNLYAKTSGDATWQRSNAGPTGIVVATSIGTFAGIEPWVALVGPGTDLGVSLAVLQAAVNLRGASLSGREGLAFESTTPYVSVAVAVGLRASAATDADVFGGQHLTDAQQIPELVARA
jgi:hypothetical protein